MAERLRGEVRARRLRALKTSTDPAVRAAAHRMIQRLGAWVGLQVGSKVSPDDRDALLNQAINDVIDGRVSMSSVEFPGDEEFEKALRLLLAERCQVWLGW